MGSVNTVSAFSLPDPLEFLRAFWITGTSLDVNPDNWRGKEGRVSETHGPKAPPPQSFPAKADHTQEL